MNVRRQHISGLAVAAVTALGLGTLSACSDSVAVGNTEKFDVVASFYPMAYLAEEIDTRHLGAAMGLYISGNSLGGLGGRIISGSVAEFWGWRGALGAIGLVSLVCALWFARTLPPSRNFRAQPLQLSRLARSLLDAFRDPLLRTTVFRDEATVPGSRP